MTANDFTERQVEVVHLLAEGLTYGEIGELLGKHYRTAKAHTGAVRHKLAQAGYPTRTVREVPAQFWRATGVNPYPRSLSDLTRT